MPPKAYTYNIFSDEGERAVTVLPRGGAPLAATDQHPSFDAIITRILADPTSQDVEDIVALFDAAKHVASRFERLGERVSYAHGRLFVDGDEMEDAVAKQIVRLVEADEDFEPLVKFLERLLSNPSKNSRDQLYPWLDQRDFTISRVGMIVAYKGVYEPEPGLYTSATSGTATVNGEVFERQRIPQRVGDIVEMPRSEVDDNGANACSGGLHVATFDFAKGFASVVLEVHVDPRDVVSVPTYDVEKMRVCRYRVVGPIQEEYQLPILEEVAEIACFDVYKDAQGRAYVASGETRPAKAGEHYASTNNTGVALLAFSDHWGAFPKRILIPLGERSACCAGVRKGSEDCCGDC